MYRNLKEPILTLRKEGKSYKQIVNILKCSIGTVAFHASAEVRRKQVVRCRESRRASAQAFKKKMGGSCVICGYSKCLTALEFHHRDPASKSFKLADAFNGSKKKAVSIKKIESEAAKCVLICANCHREVHAGLTELPASKSGVPVSVKRTDSNY